MNEIVSLRIGAIDRLMIISLIRRNKLRSSNTVRKSK
jgi:hypothetical protein